MEIFYQEMACQRKVILLVFELFQNHQGGSSLCKWIIDKINAIKRQRNRIGKIKKIVQRFLVQGIQPDFEWDQEQKRVQKIKVQNSRQVESQSASHDPEKQLRGQSGKQTGIEKIKQNPANRKEEHYNYNSVNQYNSSRRRELQN
jgi:hypothetical protein